MLVNTFWKQRNVSFDSEVHTVFVSYAHMYMCESIKQGKYFLVYIILDTYKAPQTVSDPPAVMPSRLGLYKFCVVQQFLNFPVASVENSHAHKGQWSGLQAWSKPDVESGGQHRGSQV